MQRILKIIHTKKTKILFHAFQEVADFFRKIFVTVIYISLPVKIKKLSQRNFNFILLKNKGLILGALAN